MPTLQGSGERQTIKATKDATYETNDGFIADINENNNNIRLNENTEQDEMALKTTVVSVLGNGTGIITEKNPRRSGTWSRPACVFLVISAFLLLVAFIAILLLYIQEVDGSESSGLYNDVCFKDNCIRRSAGKI